MNEGTYSQSISVYESSRLIALQTVTAFCVGRSDMKFADVLDAAKEAHKWMFEEEAS